MMFRRAMKVSFQFVLSLALFCAQASACTIPPASAQKPLSLMYEQASTIYVGDLVEISVGETTRSYTVHAVENIKGIQNEYSQIRLRRPGYLSSTWLIRDFDERIEKKNRHDKVSFWLRREGGAGTIDADCSVTFFPQRGRYLIFGGLDDVRAMEPIAQTDDLWLARVRGVAHGGAPYLIFSPLQFLRQFKSIYASKCGPFRWYEWLSRGRLVFGDEIGKYTLWQPEPEPIFYPQVDYCEAPQETTRYLAAFANASERFPTAFPIVDGKIIFAKKYGDIELTGAAIPLRELPATFRVGD